MAAFTRSDYTIQRAPQQCSVIVGRNPTRSVAKLLRDGGANNVAIVTDDKVPLYVVDRVFVSLGDYDIKCDVLKFPSGEASKHLKHLPAYVDWLTSRGFGKRDYVWGVGGGVVTDVAGLLAAGLGRGANFVSSPSTLLGMVDAGMCGKTGMDTDDGKNLFGAIYQPRYVVDDIEVLQTLSDNQLRSGASEAIKTAVIGNPLLLRYMERNSGKLIGRDLEFLERVVSACAKYKMSVVQEDPEEKLGRREELNFGHTVAHGLEKVSKFSLDHGFAVSIGMVAESRFAKKYGFSEQHRLMEILSRGYGLSVSLARTLPVDEIIKATKWDKKNTDVDGVRKVKCSLPIAVGRMHPDHSVVVEENEMREVLESMAN